MYIKDREYERFLSDEKYRASQGAKGQFEQLDEDAGPDLTDEEIGDLEEEAEWDDLMRSRSKLP